MISMAKQREEEKKSGAAVHIKPTSVMGKKSPPPFRPPPQPRLQRIAFKGRSRPGGLKGPSRFSRPLGRPTLVPFFSTFFSVSPDPLYIHHRQSRSTVAGGYHSSEFGSFAIQAYDMVPGVRFCYPGRWLQNNPRRKSGFGIDGDTVTGL